MEEAIALRGGSGALFQNSLKELTANRSISRFFLLLEAKFCSTS